MPGPTWRKEWTQLVNTFAPCRSGVVQEYVERLLAEAERLQTSLSEERRLTQIARDAGDRAVTEGMRRVAALRKMLDRAAARYHERKRKANAHG